eukprot:g5965.t1
MNSNSILGTALTLTLLSGAAMGGGEVTLLPALGGSGSVAWDINDLGQIVGQANLAGDTLAHAVLWENGGATDLGVWGAPGDLSLAQAINNQGQIVGYSEIVATGARECVLWATDLSMRNLGREMSASGSSIPWDINEQGEVCGQAALSPGFSKGFIWDDANGGRTEGTVSLYMGGANKGLNNSGVLVGHGFFFGDPDTAMLATPDGRGGWDETEIGPPGFIFSIASEISDAGVVVGFTNAGGGGGPWNACVFTQEAPGYVSLGTLPELENSEAIDVNESGLVVGLAFDNDFLLPDRAWAYLDGTMHDLNDLLEPGSEFQVLLGATGVNEHNDIVGYGLTKAGALAGFLIEGYGKNACVADLAEPLEMKALMTALALGALAGGAGANVADFDSDTEGFKGTSFTSGGITFFDLNTHAGMNVDGSSFVAGEYGTDLIVERALPLIADFPGQASSPNVLGWGSAFVPGDNLTVNIFSDVAFTTGSVENFVSLDMFYYENGPWGGIELHLDAMLGGSVVASDGFTIANGGGRDNITSAALSISGVSFDELRLYATLSDGTFTAMTGVLDNVTITPAPSGVALLGLGGLALVRRRR